MKWIYLIKQVDIQNDVSYKIGITKNDPKKRIKQLQTGNPSDLFLEKQFHSEHANLVESTLHRQFASNHIRGEWFYMTQEDVDSFVDECEKKERNFKMLKQENTWWEKINYKYIS